MASSSGTKDGGAVGVGKTLSRKMTKMPTMKDVPEEEPTADSERVPSSLAEIVPILRVANEIEQLNPRVAYLCRFHAFEKTHNLDPTSSGRGVRQFKTYLLHKLEKDEVETKPLLAKNDPREIQKFYQWYYENYVKEGPTKQKPEQMAKHYQIASVLYDVLKTVVPSEKVDDEINRCAREVERKKVHYGRYNILPLHASGAVPAIMELAEIQAAATALRNKLDQLPLPRVQPIESSVQPTASGRQRIDGPSVSGDRDNSVRDLLDWLWLTFGFQVACNKLSQVDDDTMNDLLDQVFKNYRSWCHYLHNSSNLKLSISMDKFHNEYSFVI